MEPDFDDDALIDDYIQEGWDDDEPPPPTCVDDDEWQPQEEADATTVGGGGGGGTGGRDPVPPVAPWTTSTATVSSLRPAFCSPEPQDEEALSDHNDDDDPMRDDEDDEYDDERGGLRVREVLAHKRQRIDPYAFERYQENHHWREEVVESPNAAMRATKWKSIRKSTTTARPLFGLDVLGKPHQHTKPPPFSLSHNNNNHGRFRTQPDTIKLYCTYRPRPGETSVSLTCRHGSRLDVKVLAEPIVTQSGRDPRPSSHSSSSSLLGVSMGELMRRVQVARRQREHDQLQQALALSASSEEEVSGRSGHDHRLWVDKYAPTAFAHLLSDERTNREVVRALRAWDPYVFKRDPPRTRHSTNNNWAPPTTSGDNQNHKTGISPPPKAPNSNPKDVRPDASSRVILLSGPPGIGKTTLAHVLARHAGYHPVEVNGSDDRTAQVLRDRVVALESDRLSFANGGDRRPNCLILDEIDGVDAKGAIAALVELVRADMPSRSVSSSTTDGTDRKKAPAPYLRRPIILICNNRYEPALRPLLPHCRHFALNPPSESRLASRLRECLRLEGLAASGASVLHQLGAVANGDVRSCLHALQFAAARAKEDTQRREVRPRFGGDPTTAPAAIVTDVSQALLESLSGGNKDSRNDAASTLTAVFHHDKGKRGSNATAPSVDKVLEAVQAFGDHTRILDGLFLNILGVSYIDPTLDKCSAAHKWLSDADLFRHNGSEACLPAVAGAVHLLCRVEQRPDLVFTTRALADAHYQTEANRALLGKFADGLAPQAASTRSNGCTGLAMETVPYSLWILSAGEGCGALDRPVTTYELLTKAEVSSFHNHLDALKSLGLSYRASAEDKGDPQQRVALVQLDPPIDQLAQFAGLRLAQEQTRREVAPSVKELLAQKAAYLSIGINSHATEVSQKLSQKAKVARSQGNVENAGSPLVPVKEDVLTGSTRSTSPSRESPPKAKRVKATAQNFLQIGARKAKESKSARNAARVGFLRSQKVKLSHTGSGVPLSQVVRLKYVKGFTEAVRTPCTLKDLR